MGTLCSREKTIHAPVKLLLPNSHQILAKFLPWQRWCESWWQGWSLWGARLPDPRHQALLSPHSFTPLASCYRCAPMHFHKHLMLVLQTLSTVELGIQAPLSTHQLGGTGVTDTTVLPTQSEIVMGVIMLSVTARARGRNVPL